MGSGKASNFTYGMDGDFENCRADQIKGKAGIENCVDSSEGLLLNSRCEFSKFSFVQVRHLLVEGQQLDVRGDIFGVGITKFGSRESRQ